MNMYIYKHELPLFVLHICLHTCVYIFTYIAQNLINYVNKVYKLKPSSVYVATNEVDAENLDLLQNAGFKLLKKTALVLGQLQTIIVDLQMMSASQEFLSWVSS